MSANYMLYGSYKHITEEEFNEWMDGANIIEYAIPVFTSFCGPHEFCNVISKGGVIYDMGYGWDIEKDESPDAKYPCKTTYWWGIRKMKKDAGQEGDGI